MYQVWRFIPPGLYANENSHYVLFPALMTFYGEFSSARFLWRNIQYAILGIFIIAAVLTPSTDPWNQIVFAAPMIGLYLLSIAIAWIVAPQRGPHDGARTGSAPLQVVFGAAVVDQAGQRRTRPSTGRRRRLSLADAPPG